MPSNIHPSGHPDNPNDKNDSDSDVFIKKFVEYVLVCAVILGVVAFVTLMPSPATGAVVLASCIHLWGQLRSPQPVE